MVGEGAVDVVVDILRFVSEQFFDQQTGHAVGAVDADLQFGKVGQVLAQKVEVAAAHIHF